MCIYIYIYVCICVNITYTHIVKALDRNHTSASCTLGAGLGAMGKGIKGEEAHPLLHISVAQALADQPALRSVAWRGGQGLRVSLLGLSDNLISNILPQTYVHILGDIR